MGKSIRSKSVQRNRRIRAQQVYARERVKLDRCVRNLALATGVDGGNIPDTTGVYETDGMTYNSRGAAGRDGTDRRMKERKNKDAESVSDGAQELGAIFATQPLAAGEPQDAAAGAAPAGGKSGMEVDTDVVDDILTHTDKGVQKKKVERQRRSPRVTKR